METDKSPVERAGQQALQDIVSQGGQGACPAGASPQCLWRFCRPAAKGV